MERLRGYEAEAGRTQAALRALEQLPDDPASLADLRAATIPDHVPVIRERESEPLVPGWVVRRADVGFDEGTFAFLYPEHNSACATAIAEYSNCLRDADTLAPWTLEDFVRDVRAASESAWIKAFERRYLSFDRF